MQRIMIIGGPGSGKSTLAQKLGERTNLPVYHMDHIHWLPGWVDRPKDEKMRLALDIISRDTWVFEGGHSRSYTARLERAEMLVWLDVPVSIRLWRAIRRTVRDRGRVRQDMQQDCPEMLSMLPGFCWFILRHHRSARQRQQALFEAACLPKHRLQRLRDVNAFLASFETSSPDSRPA